VSSELEHKYGKPWSPIPGSWFYRAYCPGCGDPVRVDARRAKKEESIYCEECDPPHQGCSSPANEKVDGIDGDTDAFKPSWRE